MIVAEGVERREELERAARSRGRLRPGLAVRPPRGRRGRRYRAPTAPALHVRTPVGGDRLERGIAAAPTARGRVRGVVDHLARTGLMPSVYLEQGGRLRCQAVARLLAVYDGMPPKAGVDRPRVPHRRDRATSPTSPRARATSTRCRRSSAVAVRAAAHRRPRRRRASTPSRRPPIGARRASEVERSADAARAAASPSSAALEAPTRRPAPRPRRARLAALEDPERSSARPPPRRSRCPASSPA